FIRASIKKPLAEVANKVNDLKAQIRSSYGLLKRKRELARQIERDELELDSMTKRVEALRGELKGLTKTDQKVLALHDPLLQEEQCVEQFGRDLNRLREMASEFESSLVTMPTIPAKSEESPNLDLLNKAENSLKGVFTAATVKVRELIKLLNETSPQVAEYEKLVGEWKAIFTAHCEQYEQAKQRASSHRAQL